MNGKLVLLALLAGSMLAVSPSAVGQHYDDTLHNNLSIGMRSVEAEVVQSSTHPVIVPLAHVQIMALCANNMRKEDFLNAKSEIKKTIADAKQSDSHKTFHALFIAMDKENSEARTYELTIVRNEKSLVGVVSSKTHSVEDLKESSFYFERYTSAFGLPFSYLAKSETISQDLTADMVQYIREYLLKGAEAQRKTNMHSEKGLGAFLAWVTAASEAVKTLTEAAKGIIAVFKTVKTETLKEHVKGEGFSAYRAMSNYSRILGVPLAKYDTFIPSFMIQMGLNRATRKEEMQAYFTLAQFASNEWKLNDFVFGTGRKDNICNNLVITNQIDYTDNVVHFVAVNVQGSFELAPDTLVYTQYKSVFGGISETTKDVRKSVPRDIKDDEIKAINALMVLNAINVYSENMNIKFQLPSNDPWKM